MIQDERRWVIIRKTKTCSKQSCFVLLNLNWSKFNYYFQFVHISPLSYLENQITMKLRYRKEVWKTNEVVGVDVVTAIVCNRQYEFMFSHEDGNVPADLFLRNICCFGSTVQLVHSFFFQVCNWTIITPEGQIQMQMESFRQEKMEKG